MHVVNITILVFDYSLTLNREMSLIWLSKWSISKILFCLSRYSPVFDVPILLYYSMKSDMSFEHCSQLYAGTAWGTIFGIAAAEAILVLRTYALSGRKRGVLIFFTTLWACAVSASIVLSELFLRSVTYGPPPSPDIPGCFLTQGNVVFATIPFVIVLLNDTIIMAYTVWIGLTNYRHSRNPVVATLYRDGIMYYLFLSIISAINLVTLLKAPTAMAQLFNTFLRVMHSVLSTRILLHVRDVEHIDSERTIGRAPRVTLSFAIPDPEVL
ncbi:hypothetical protein C8R44DRAFT_170912 [Mycena epipterygia]|nr:hypothetical protein C8R44DRAFT_170912 [Mycena epipterygia]